MEKRIAVLVSGGGTNLQALIDAQNAGIIKSGQIDLVISNNAEINSDKNKKKMTKKEIEMNIEMLEQEMREAARNLDFERAMELRDIIFEMKSS